MSAVINKSSSGDAVRFRTTPAAASSKSWKEWRLVQMLKAIIGTLKQAAHFFMPSDGRTAEKRRVAEKARQKEIRRELRGLPATTDSSNGLEQPVQ
jgi:hypothetical protein